MSEAAEELEKLKKAVHTMLDHHYNCFGACPRYDQSVALLARASGYKNDLFEDDICNALKEKRHEM